MFSGTVRANIDPFSEYKVLGEDDDFLFCSWRVAGLRG